MMRDFKKKQDLLVKEQNPDFIKPKEEKKK